MDGPADEICMARALQLARCGWYTTQPNPRVGCVIVQRGSIVGEGWHRRAGDAHAEVDALRRAGARARGGTAYVTLEPCSHHGRTPPCTEALIAAGIARVVIGAHDPHGLAGGGSERLRAAGIAVEGPLLEVQARALNAGFFQRCETGMPRVIVKVAASLDGRSAMASGESQWITGAAARADGQRLRAGCGAIITGVGTVVQDNPALTVRAAELGLPDAAAIAALQPLRVIVDSNGQSLTRASELRIFSPPGAVLVVTGRDTAAPVGVGEVLACPNREGKVDLAALLRELGRRQCNDVLVEAGARLTGAFLAAGLVDEMVCYLAPKLLGSLARPLAELRFATMAEALPLRITDIRALGDDWRIVARPEARFRAN